MQVEGLQEGIAKLKTDIKEAKGRGEEKERQQREQLANMERRLDASQHEAEAAETKLELMETVIDKLKAGTEQLYYNAKVGSTPVLSLLSAANAAGTAAGGAQQAKEQAEAAEDDGALPRKQFVTENNVIMYLDMVHEKVVELQAVSQYLTYREQLEAAEAAALAAGGAGGGMTAQLQAVMLLQQQQAAAQAHVHAGGGVKLSISGAAGPVTSGAVSVEKQLKRMPSSAQMLGKHDEELGLDEGEQERKEGDDEDGEIKPFDLTALKTRAFVVTQRERREAALAAVKAAGEGGAGGAGDGGGGEGIDGVKKDHHGGKRSRAGVRKNKH